jgi:hypothetical protein
VLSSLRLPLEAILHKNCLKENEIQISGLKIASPNGRGF